MAKNRYTIGVTLLHNVQIEADSEEEALKGVHDVLFEDGYGDLSVAATSVDEVIEDGPAKYEAWRKAWRLAHVAEDRFGRDSDEYKAAVAAVPSESGL